MQTELGDIMKENKLINLMEKIIYIYISIILFILPFPRGLFFEREVLPTELAIYILFIFWSIVKCMKNEKVGFKSPLSIAVCLLPIAYMLPTFLGYAANKTDAISYVMRYSAYFAVFIIASDRTKDKQQLNWILYPIALSGLCVGLLGVDALAGGAIGTKLGFSSIGFTWNRLYGVMQYANTMGMYYGIMFFVVIAIALLCSQRYIKAISAGLLFLMIMGILFTMSRGALLILPIVYLVLLVLLPEKTQKIELVLVAIIPVVLSFVLYIPLQQASPIINEATGVAIKVWFISALGSFVSVIASLLLLQLRESFNKISEKTYSIMVVGGIIIVVLAVAILFLSGMYTKIVPQAILERFMQKGDAATSGRTDFYRDGLRVLKDKWLLGAGGGAWNAVYRAYQSYDYGSSEAHNLLLQVWIETGVIGIGAYIFVMILAIKAYIDCRIKKMNSDVVILLLAVVFYTIGHSMIDFDFSYFSIPVIVFTLLGALNGISTVKNTTENKKTIANKVKLPVWSTTVIGILFSIVALCFIMARSYAVQATTLLKNEQITSGKLLAANEKMQKATKLNPWNINFYVMEKKTDADMQVDLNTLYNLVEQADPNNKTVLQLHKDVINKAVKLNPKNPTVNIMAAGFMISKAGDIENGIKYMDKALENNPMSAARYEETANLYFEVGKAFIERGDKVKATQYLQRVVKLEEDIQKLNKKAIKPVQLSQNTLAYIEKAKLLLQ
jgi:O-antigen ligase/Tfp pilus assembly protein PilF